MSRHRNVRSMNYEEDFYEDDDYLGHSVEDNYCISPGTAAQFTFNRGERNVNLASYVEEGIPEEDEEESDEDTVLNHSSGTPRLQLNETDQAKLNSCLDEVRNVLGESCPEHIMAQTIVKHKYNIQSTLNELLNQTGTDAPKPQRQPRESRRNRSQAFATVPPTVILKVPQKGRQSSKSPDKTINSNDKATNSQFNSDKSESLQKSESQTLSNNVKTSLNIDSDKVKMVASNSMDSNLQTGKTDLKTDSGIVTVKSDSKVDTLKVESKTDNLLTPKKDPSLGAIPRSASKAKLQLDPAKMKEEYDKRLAEKDQLNMVVIGHVDAGKSTLMGHLLYQLGEINQRIMHKYEQESKKLGKGSFAFAWVLDETEEERVRGVTMDIAQSRFETPKKVITLLDAPGHKDFIPNMITGTAQADVAILVVNATKGEFETGFELGGQTREHAILARSLGVTQLIVAVNKMDTVDWLETRYNDITKKLGQFLKQVGYKENDISFIPCSGLSGVNLTGRIPEPKLETWYKGSTLEEQIDKFKVVTRSIDKPFRLCVGDIFKGMGSGFSVTGRIVTGSVQPGDRLLVLPSGDYVAVKGLAINDVSFPCAFAGDHVTITITGMDMNNIHVGSMLCDPSSPLKSATRIKAKIVLFNVEIPITKGFMVVFHYQSITEPAVIKRLNSQLNKSTGEVIKNRPKCLVKNMSAVVELEFDRPICLELYKDFKDLGRFMLRYSGHTIAAGLVEEVLKSKSKTDEGVSSSG